MKNFNLHYDDCSVYPGDYVPLLKTAAMQEELKIFKKNELVFPPTNITELTDAYKVEVAIPGVKREDFLVQADGNILYVTVVHKELGNAAMESFQLHEFNYNCFNRHIVLPYNADTEFISAEYNAGILRLYIPKVNMPVSSLNTRIVVY